MQLNQARILLTGASGGLGTTLAQSLADAGAALLLCGRDLVGVEAINLPEYCEHQLVAADLTQTSGIENTVAAAQKFGVNVLINNAGVSAFGLLEQQAWMDVERILSTNLGAPVRLTQALLPWLQARPEAAVVNIGSTFGSIPFAGFTAYSAAKAGLRGFSQALRRELADSTVRVMHICPRAIDTPINSPVVKALNKALGSATDSPEDVAQHVLNVLSGNINESHIGFPERFFAWLNGFAPGLVDQGLKGKLATIKQYASKA